ncbi:phosphatidylglycerophosphatase A [Geomonas paludis]|uniref:Phosphatidylglycerophosphatase A n=1 Tax=Geomonas paludis TaxID=2740185 RepID=A0A6V8N0G2_9BACT|nr:phosphatidylglycerophosphatase A [Geomonas paludis]UPU36585.1 phosphatidylglycerophosphatase A [Geomonas paludis]GFO65840.1 phosphatidylglycerophosphatase A [Geomonas paludis]
MKKFVIISATWFGTGFSPFASGTVGTVGAIPFFLLLSGMPLWLYLLTTVAFTLFACWSAGFGEELWGEHDSGKIVIDEVAGYLVTMTAVPVTWQGVLAGFIMFRIFDILKPQPARWFDRSLKNGYGVVLDDIVAGIYACAATHLLLRLL